MVGQLGHFPGARVGGLGGQVSQVEEMGDGEEFLCLFMWSAYGFSPFVNIIGTCSMKESNSKPSKSFISTTI
jgi:hypothetical protein